MRNGGACERAGHLWFFSQTSLSVARRAFAGAFFISNGFHEFPRTTALGRRIPCPCLVKSRRFDPGVKDLINPVSFTLINMFGFSNGLERIAVSCIFRVEHNPPRVIMCVWLQHLESIHLLLPDGRRHTGHLGVNKRRIRTLTLLHPQEGLAFSASGGEKKTHQHGFYSLSQLVFYNLSATSRLWIKYFPLL